jgi:antirestriction protein
MEEVMGVQFNPAETDRPRIYVACLASYNNGQLHGAWIDAGRDVWELWDDVQTMLAASPVPDAEEYAIHDYEGFAGARISEHQGLDSVAQIAAFIVEHGPVGGELLNYLGGDVDEARAVMADQYLGCHASLADHMQELTEETITIPDGLRFYIDWQAMARDAECGGDLFTICTGHDEVHVFAGG